MVRRTLLWSLLLVAIAGWPSTAGAAVVAVGARVPGAPQHPGAMDRYAAAVGRSPVIVAYYREWGQPVLDARSLKAISSRGAVPMISWDPLVPGWRRGEPSPILRQIAAGRWDAYLEANARAAASWHGEPILLRFAPEMNGNWSPWDVQVPGNTAAQFIAAWRHVVSLFRRAGATKVRWVWCPNVEDGGRLPFSALFPGNAWVDWVGLDGYNWGGSWPWESFTRIFAESYDTLARLSRKPMLIGEMSSGEEGGSKAQWIESTFTQELPRFNLIRALVWFNGDGFTRRFSFDTSPQAESALRRVLSLPRYRASRQDVLSPGPAGPFTPVPVPAPSLREWIRGHELLLALAAALLVGLAAAAAAVERRRRRRGEKQSYASADAP